MKTFIRIIGWIIRIIHYIFFIIYVSVIPKLIVQFTEVKPETQNLAELKRFASLHATKVAILSVIFIALWFFILSIINRIFSK